MALSLMVHGKSPMGDDPSLCPQRTSRERVTHGARGIPGHGPHLGHTQQHLQNHTCVPPPVLQAHGKGKCVQTRTRMCRGLHVGDKGTGKGWSWCGSKGGPQNWEVCERECWLGAGQEAPVGTTCLGRHRVGAGQEVLGGLSLLGCWRRAGGVKGLKHGAAGSV